MLENCANNIHLMLIKNEQKYVNNLYISKKALKTVHKKIKANCLNIIHYCSAIFFRKLSFVVFKTCSAIFPPLLVISSMISLLE